MADEDVLEAVERMCAIFNPNAGFYGDTMASLGCDEADALIHLFSVAGYPSLAASLLDDHIAGDYPEDRHYVKGESREEGAFYG